MNTLTPSSFPPVINRYVKPRVPWLLDIMDDKTMPSWAFQDAVQSNEDDQRYNNIN